MYRKLSTVAIVLILTAGASASWTYTFDCDQVISGLDQTGVDGSPWFMDIYGGGDQGIPVNAWQASSGIVTLAANPDFGADGALLSIRYKAANGSDGLAHTIDVRAARPNNTWSNTNTKMGIGFYISVPVNSTSRKLYMLDLGNLNDVTDTDRLGIMLYSGSKGSKPTFYHFDVPGLNINNYNVYRMAMNATGDLNIYVNDMNTAVYSQSTLPTYYDDGQKASFGFVSPRDGDDNGNWQLNIDYVYINSTTCLVKNAATPKPSHTTDYAAFNTQLYWSAGMDACSHSIYLGTDYDNVDTALGDDSVFDLDGDGQKDFNDFALFALNWGRTDCNSSNNYCSGSDFGQDGNVDGNDLKVVANEWLTDSAFKANQVVGATSFNPGTLQRHMTYYWRIDEVNGPNTWKGQLWQFATTVSATNPNPDDDTLDLPADTTLSWNEPSNIADCNFNVYFSTSYSSVAGASAAVLEANNINTNSCTPASALVAGTQYYWRVDVMDPAGRLYQGNVWNFTTFPLQAHKLPQPAYCEMPILLEGEDFDSQSGGWSASNEWFTQAAKNNSAGTGQYLEWNDLTIPVGDYELWFSISRIGSVTAKDYKLYAGPNTTSLRQVANLNIAWGTGGSD
ncbi:MAG: hypothetical protein QGG54_13490, partial [Gammaproteobacteria bacterium]|nr:hypothetical protein [Gammaproteobacteria bacterium]